MLISKNDRLVLLWLRIGKIKVRLANEALLTSRRFRHALLRYIEKKNRLEKIHLADNTLYTKKSHFSPVPTRNFSNIQNRFPRRTY